MRNDSKGRIKRGQYDTWRWEAGEAGEAGARVGEAEGGGSREP